MKNVDPLLKVLHIPTARPRIQLALSNPEAADDSQAILLYAICYSSIITLDSDEVRDLLGVERNVLMRRFGEGIEQYLTKFSLIVNPTIEYMQALIIHVVCSLSFASEARSRH